MTAALLSGGILASISSKDLAAVWLPSFSVSMRLRSWFSAMLNVRLAKRSVKSVLLKIDFRL